MQKHFIEKKYEEIVIQFSGKSEKILSTAIRWEIQYLQCVTRKILPLVIEILYFCESHIWDSRKPVELQNVFYKDDKDDFLRI